MTTSNQAQTSLISYNIKYDNEGHGEHSWLKRKDHLTAQLSFYEPDIIGIQEALYGQVEHLEKNLTGYKHLGAGRDDGKEKGEYSAIFYKSEKFDVVESDTFWLSETPEKPSTGWDAAYARICTYALFKKKEGEGKFWVFNTHFDHKGEEARKKSASLILKQIEKLNEEDLPVFLMGDLNLEPDSKPVGMLAESLEDSRETAKEVIFGPDGTFNGFEFNKPVKRRIDYIFTSKGNVEVLKHGVLSDSKDLRYPSDHLPVLILVDF